MSDAAITPDRPTAAGMYDYYLGGAAHTPVDRAAAEQVAQVLPDIGDIAWSNRGFLQRAVRAMAADWGIRQFLDLGAGLPTQRNTHDVVAEVTGTGRVVYVDIDPAAVARGNQLLGEVPGASMIEADLCHPEQVLEHPETRRLLDRTEPVGVLLVAVLHFVTDDQDPWGLVRRYLDAVPAGSYLALSHGSGEQTTPRVHQAVAAVYARTPTPLIDRNRTEIERFFQGLEIVSPYPDAAPGLVFAGLWGADDPELADSDGSRFSYAGVGRKP